MIAKPALAGFLLLASSQLANAQPQFEAGIEVKRAGLAVEIREVIANHSSHPVCMPLFQGGSFVTHYANGSSIPLAAQPISGWDGGTSAPSPIQIIPNDGVSRRYTMAKVSLFRTTADAAQARSVETTIQLFDCAEFFSGKKFIPREVFRITVKAPITGQ